MIEETQNYQITILRYMDETDEDIDAKLARWRAGEDVPELTATPTDGEELIVTIKQFGQKRSLVGNKSGSVAVAHHQLFE